MSTAIETILSRAMSEPDFADKLFSDPESALAGYELSSAELAQFKKMSRADFAALSPEDRKSMALNFYKIK